MERILEIKSTVQAESQVYSCNRPCMQLCLPPTHPHCIIECTSLCFADVDPLPLCWDEAQLAHQLYCLQI